MQSILEEFARGNINPEPRFFKRDSRYGRLIKQLADTEEKLLATLNGEEQMLLEGLVDTQTEVSLLSGVDRFLYGYRLGVLMTIEVFSGKESLLAYEEDCP